MKMPLKMSSGKWRPFCPGGVELNADDVYMRSKLGHGCTFKCPGGHFDNTHELLNLTALKC